MSLAPGRRDAHVEGPVLLLGAAFLRQSAFVAREGRGGHRPPVRVRGVAVAGGVGDVSGLGRPAEGLGTSGLLAAHEPPPVAQSAVEVDVGLEGVGVFEYSPAVPADVTLLTCGGETPH